MEVPLTVALQGGEPRLNNSHRVFDKAVTMTIANLWGVSQGDGGALHIHNALIVLALLAGPGNGGLKQGLVQIKDLALCFWSKP